MTTQATMPPAAPVPSANPPRRWLRHALRISAVLVALIYLIGISAWLLTHGGWPTPDYLIPPLLLLAIAFGRGWSFVFDWGPFLALVLSWQATASVANKMGRPVHYYGPPGVDLWLFRGNLPTVELQERLYNPGRPQWYDWAATFQHALHFVLPVAVGLLIWSRSRGRYWRYLLSVLLLFYLGFAGYAWYPAAPPWLAASRDIIPPVDRVAIETLSTLPASAPIGLAYTRMSYNPVAAMPSLHAALPMLLALVLVHLYGWKLLPLVLYPLTMGFNLVYMGEHWVIDVLVGWGVALLAYLAVWVLPGLVPWRWRWRVRRPAWQAPSPLRWAGAGALPMLAVTSIAVIAFSLRPTRPAINPGPVVPGLQVQTGQTSAPALVTCDMGPVATLSVDYLLQPVSGRYSAYLFDLDGGACYTLTAQPSFRPPRPARIPDLAARAPLRRTSPRGETSDYIALQDGAPAAHLILAGAAPERRYLLLVALGGVVDIEGATEAVDQLVNQTLLVSPPAPPEPDLDPPAERTE